MSYNENGDKMKKITTILIITISIFFFTNSVQALTLRELNNQLASLENSYNAAQKKANMTQSELNNVKASIASTEAEIRKSQEEIIQAENEIKASEEEIAKKKEETNQMLLYLQLINSNGDSLLEYIFESDNYTDFIYRYAVVSQLGEYNNELMKELNNLISTLQAKKVTLSQKQQELSNKKTELQEKYLIVQAQYKEQQDEGLSVKDQISEKRKLINMYKSMGCSMDQDVNSCSGIAAVDGWTYPLDHFIQSSIYAESRGSVKHYAVDLGTPEYSKVYAVANGEVISAIAKDCGGMIIQIKHRYNGSYYVSLYMHLIDSYVGMGSKVTGGQVIGTSGGGIHEKAKWGERCSDGAHLHFAMSSGEGTIGYSSERGSTFDPIRFFPAMKGYGSSI